MAIDYDFDLTKDEAVLRTVDGITFHVAQDGLAKWIDSPNRIGLLALTTQRLLFCWEEGTFKKRQETVSIALSQIRSRDSKYQIIISMPKSFGGPFSMTVYALDQQYTFEIPLLKRMAIDDLVNAANEIAFGVSSKKSAASLVKGREGVKVGKALSGAFNSAKPVIKDAADAAKPFVPLAAEVVSVAFPGVRAISDALSEAASKSGKDVSLSSSENSGELASDAKAETVTKSEDSLDTLIKLKELLDGGILTQEEFDAKKRQLLGL